MIKINELIEGKTYQWMNTKYRIENGILIVKIGNLWEPSSTKYNSIVKADFEEVILIPDENTPMSTKVRVKDFGSNMWIYPRYFAMYLPNCESKFCCFHGGDDQKTATSLRNWRYCEIIEESEVVE